MKKLFVISPISIAGCLILHGLAEAFRELGVFTVEKDVREVTFEEIQKYKPDYILGYDYGFLVNKELSKDLKKLKGVKFLHYFADEPKSKFAYTDNPEMYEELKKLKNKYVFNWDPEFLNDFEGSKYLPLGINKKLYKTEFSGYEHNISFVGRPLTEKRQAVLTRLIKEFGEISLFCYEDHFKRSIKEIEDKNLLTEQELDAYKASYKGFVKTEKELAKIYNSSKVNINVTEQGLNNINYRVFEVLASSGFLITDEMKDLYVHFEVGKELEVYHNIDDLADKIKFYLENLDIAHAIARKGRKHVAQNHTFKNRVEKIMKIIKN